MSDDEIASYQETTLSPEDRLETLKSIREEAFADITALRDEVSALSKTRATLIITKYNSAQNLLKQATSIRDKIIRWNKQADPDKRLEVSKVHRSFVDIFNVIEACYAEAVDHQKAQSGASASTAPQAHVGPPTPNRGVRLPNIEIPIFEGSIREFPRFQELFQCVYGAHQSLSDSEKAYYLRSLLRGEALNLVSNFSLDQQGYADAWQALKDMYASNRALASINITDILSFSPLKKANGENLKNYLSVHNYHVQVLKNLGLPDLADFILQELSSRNLDPLTRRLFEQSIPAGTIPSHKALMDFVSKQSHMLDILKSEQQGEDPPTANIPRKNQNPSSKIFKVASPATTKKSIPITTSCLYCSSKDHKIYKCDSFQSANVSERHSWVTKANLCVSCLGKGHTAKNCKSLHKCKICNMGNHHSLLHREKTLDNSVPMSSKTMSVHVDLPEKPHVLLGTLLAHTTDVGGFTRTLRALLDCGSQRNLISVNAVKRLGLTCKSQVTETISGISDVQTQVIGEVSLTIQSKTNPQFSQKLVASVVPSITSYLPSAELSTKFTTKFKNSLLADPNFGNPSPVDLLLNAEIFMDIVITNSVEPLPDNALLTKFGVIVMGKLPNTHEARDRVFLTTSPPLLENLEKFWESEEISTCSQKLTVEEIEVESHFQTTHKRAENGRFIVKLPFKPDPPVLGSTRYIAKASLISLEKRLKRNEISHYEEYKSILANYLSQGHIVPSLVQSRYIIPHHIVFKRSSNKLRIVFNASCPSSTKTSLNDTLYVGPTLQRDLSYVLMGFRVHPIALTADISAMYTNIAVDPEDSEKLHMFHSNDQNDIVESRMERLPFGLSCSPFLAIRCLQQLAEDQDTPTDNTNPKARQAILKSFYVDDLLTGASSVDEAINLRNDLVALLAKGCFPLCKFKSNHVRVSAISTEEELAFSAEDVKVLGLFWKPATDMLSFKTCPFDGPISKRNVLSYCSQLYDPLGLANPVVLAMKLFIQNLWRLNLSWDEVLPPDLQISWTDLVHQMPILSNCLIPRFVFHTGCSYNLAIFCDGSQKAFGTCAYLVTTDLTTGVKMSNLLIAKSKVAPLKAKMTIPQIELSGMLLAAKLWQWLQNGELPITIESVSFYSDSQVALSWLQIDPSKLKVFVSNRVKQVRELTKPHAWHYVSTHENPADLVSRGLAPEKLLNNQFWFNGPSLLLASSPPAEEKVPLIESDLPDLKDYSKVLIVSNDPPPENEIFLKFSTLTKLQRVFVYVRRFINNCRNLRKVRNDYLSATELKESLIHLCKLHQNQYFASDITALTKNRAVGASLLPLTPFIDKDKVMRVGGRLQQANLEYDAKHPIIVAKGSFFTNLILKYYHASSGHSGPSLSLALTRQKIWPIAGRTAMRSITKNCVICSKINANRKIQPIMGDLPPERTQPAMAFRGHVAFDVAGPYSVKLSLRQTRNAQSTGKGYLLLWICLSTRAVHLEFMGSLSTESFLAAWDRMVSRRSIPTCCVSDQASNFKKGFRLIKEFSEFLEQNKSHILSTLATRSIDWKFNTVYSPDKGGIWERQIGVAKRILKGLLTSHTMFFEEYATVFAKVEALMNSRPYFPLSMDATDPVAYLTPAHFLVQSNFAPLPEYPENRDMPLHKRWDRVRALTQQFWKIWAREYLQSRISREKWAKGNANLKIGQMVLVSDIETTPAAWPLGIVTNLIAGSQGAARVADVRTSSGILRRSVNRLRIVPLVADSCK